MMPTTLGVSIFVTTLYLVTYIEELKNPLINRSLFSLSIFSWLISICDIAYHNNIFVYILFFGLLFFFILSLNQNNARNSGMLLNVEKNEILTKDFPFTGKNGTVIQKISKNKYLGTILSDKMPNQIIVYCDEELKQNDKFIIEGLKGFNIIAKKC